MKLCCWKLSLCCVVWLLLCVCVCVCVVCVCGVGCVRVVCVCVCMEIDTKQSHRTFNGTTLIHKSSDPVLYDFEISFFFFPGEFVCLREDVELWVEFWVQKSHLHRKRFETSNDFKANIITILLWGFLLLMSFSRAVGGGAVDCIYFLLENEPHYLS